MRRRFPVGSRPAITVLRSLFGVLLALTICAEEPRDGADKLFRVIGQPPQVIDLTDYFEANGKGAFPGWCVIKGRVIQTRAGVGALIGLEGMDCDGKPGDAVNEQPRKASGVVFVRNLGNCADGESVLFVAKADGMADYVSAAGAPRRVRAYDCGRIATREESKALREVRLATERAKVLERAAARAETQKRSDERERQRMALVEARIIQNLRSRIEDGSADAAVDLAKRYLEGRGVEKSDSEARKLFGLAAMRGSEEARQWLSSHSEPAPPKR